MKQPIYTENIETVMKASPNNSPNKMKEFLHTYNLKRVVKTRLILTGTGKTFLGNKSNTFQPTVPHSVIPTIKNSLRRHRLFCFALHRKNGKRGKGNCNSGRGSSSSSKSKSKSTTSSSNGRVFHDVIKNPLYHHEQMKSSDFNIFHKKTLGEFPWDVDGLMKARHNLILHLAGWEEGSAMFGLHQIYGTNENKAFQNAVTKILLFVDKLVAAYKRDSRNVGSMTLDYQNLGGQVQEESPSLTTLPPRSNSSFGSFRNGGSNSELSDNLAILANLASAYKSNYL